MTTWELLAVLLAGVGAGAINAVVGSGTLITFPTLVAFGVPPVTATMSNAIGLVAGGVSGTWGYRRELEGQWPRLRWQIPASFGGALVGCWLLLHLPERVFETIVPILLVGALVLVVAQPRIQKWAGARSDRADPLSEGPLSGGPVSGGPVSGGPVSGGPVSDLPGSVRLTPVRLVLMVAGTFAVGVYGGYFTAAQGILLMAILGVVVPDHLQRMNAAKNLLSLVVNVVAAVTYTLVAFDRIDWSAAAVIAIGSLAGGVIGARYGRRLSPRALRAVIVVVGLIGLWRLLA
ncbi:sulfite exporter TauE/SafE family protein [Gordonia terrae]|uniref:sulfite exporter TauE/SafE family protein n=1 Tax=Gordonia terrae TaxID=2055 RepID=UPI003F6CA602